ncbi:MAG: hypothetical protein J07HQX50_00734, partial [Haloquadratum sp. J07HQX50]
ERATSEQVRKRVETAVRQIQQKTTDTGPTQECVVEEAFQYYIKQRASPLARLRGATYALRGSITH